MKIKIDRDEWWPVYFRVPDFRHSYAEIELSELELARLERAWQLFDEAQAMVREKMRRANREGSDGSEA